MGVSMIGGIAGDIIGSRFEGSGFQSRSFLLFNDHSRFTDDTVLSAAVADCLLRGGDYVDAYHDYFHRYPHAGYGGTFIGWAVERRRDPYNSWGNGSAMRVGPVGLAFATLDETMAEAKRSAEVTHDHPEGIRGAQATAAAVFLARTGATKPEIKRFVETTFGYDLSRPLDEVRSRYAFDVSCQGSVPESIIAFLESTSYEDAVRNAISLGGDADTMACIAGAIAEAFEGGIPIDIETQALAHLDEPLRRVVGQFRAAHPIPRRKTT